LFRSPPVALFGFRSRRRNRSAPCQAARQVYRRPRPALRPWPHGFAPPLRPLARCWPVGDAAAWGARDKAVVWHGFTQMACYLDNEPIIVESAEGRELIDVDGR